MHLPGKKIRMRPGAPLNTVISGSPGSTRGGVAQDPEHDRVAEIGHDPVGSAFVQLLEPICSAPGP